jgi:Asp-tRNA(Asn)/Glu-tRNA(Gln) amidotransferase A subunit family amidase
VVVQRLLDAGASIQMKTNMDAFTTSGKGVTGEGGPIRNPRDIDRVAGGSSGGSAVVVTDGQVDVAVGTDTGGSVRIPAAFCGVLGLKPTYGLVSRAGVLQNSHSLDTIGFLSESTTALATVLEHAVGVDPHDAVTSHVAERDSYRTGSYVDAVERSPDLETITIGVPDEVFEDGLASEIESLLSATTTELSDVGVSVEPVSIPDLDDVSAVKDILACSELAANWQYGAIARQNLSKACEYIYHWMFNEVKPRANVIEPSLLKKVTAGICSLRQNGHTKYVRARRDQDKFRDAIDRALQNTDSLLLPTTPITPPYISDARTLSRDLGRYTLLANVTSHPALTLPMGGNPEEPIGLQLIGDHFSEGQLLGIARELQRWSVNSLNTEIGYSA